MSATEETPKKRAPARARNASQASKTKEAGSRVVKKANEIVQQDPQVPSSSQEGNKGTKSPVDTQLVKKQAKKTSSSDKQSFQLIEGSLVCELGPSHESIDLKDLYTSRYDCANPVAGAKKAFGKLCKLLDSQNPGGSSSDKKVRHTTIQYRLTVRKVLNGKNYPYRLSRTKRDDPSVVKKGDGIVQWNGDTRVKTFPSLKDASDAMGRENVGSLEELSRECPDFKWTHTGFISHFKTVAKAYNDGLPKNVKPAGKKASPSVQDSPIEISHIDDIEKVDVPQKPPKGIVSDVIPQDATSSQSSSQEAATPVKPTASRRGGRVKKN